MFLFRIMELNIQSDVGNPGQKLSKGIHSAPTVEERPPTGALIILTFTLITSSSTSKRDGVLKPLSQECPGPVLKVLQDREGTRLLSNNMEDTRSVSISRSSPGSGFSIRSPTYFQVAVGVSGAAVSMTRQRQTGLKLCRCSSVWDVKNGPVSAELNLAVTSVSPS